MRLPNIIRGRPGVTRRTLPAGTTRQRNARPKNGRLLVAVVAGLTLMVALVTINLRLIRHPAVLGKHVPNSDFSLSEPSPGPPAKADSEAAANRVHTARPEITFYRDLTSGDDQPGATEGFDRSPKDNDSESGPQQKFLELGTPKQPEREENTAKRKTVASTGIFPESPAERGSPASTDFATKTYTVQVGSFSHPAIAQQWAQNWKARGYDVELRPVARPNTGVNYRLYLGRFRSEKEADELVKRLKAKEGISAIRLMVPY